MVNLTRIYTRTGDAGRTRLGDFSETAKTDTRLAAYADVDEAGAQIGVVLAYGGIPEDVVAVLTRVQNDLFDVGADLCNPVVENPKYEPLRITEADVTRLEEACDRYNDALPKLRSFILPGGTPGAAAAHLARTVARRAERAVVRLSADEAVNPEAVRYLNRLSDLFFVLSRRLNGNGAGDVLWQPGRGA